LFHQPAVAGPAETSAAPTSVTGYLDLPAVHERVAALTSEDRRRLERGARWLADRSGASAEDLLQEAYLRVLRGSRRCRAERGVVVTLLGVMKSLAWASIEAREGSLIVEAVMPELVELAPSPDMAPEQLVISLLDHGRLLTRVYDLVSGDAGLEALVEALCDDLFGERLRAELGVDAREHDALRKRLQRRLAKLLAEFRAERG